MFSKARRLYAAIPLALLSFSVVWSQASACETLVQTALAATASACDGTGRNQACYGNTHMDAELYADFAAVDFSEPGDIVEVLGIESLRLSPLQTDEAIWGVALLRIQASLPDTLPGQNVTFLLFGDVQLRNAVEPTAGQVTLPLTATVGTNIRSQPSTDAVVLESLRAGASVTADGRLEDGSWLRVRLPNQAGSGWIFSDLVSAEGDLATLNVADPTEPVYGPMQAFYFQTGTGRAPCIEAPDSGILIQTPQGAGRITLSANKVQIRLGSTVYLQAQAGGEMLVNVLEGSARVEALGAAQYVPAGTRVRIPLDENQAAVGVPTAPEPYDDVLLSVLPIGNLERAISIAPALSPAEIEEILAAPGQPRDVAIASGLWNVTMTRVEIIEPGEDACPVPAEGFTTAILTPNEDGSGFRYEGQIVDEHVVLNFVRVAPGTYQAGMLGVTWTVSFSSPTALSGEFITPPDPEDCGVERIRTEGVAQVG